MLDICFDSIAPALRPSLIGRVLSLVRLSIRSSNHGRILQSVSALSLCRIWQYFLRDDVSLVLLLDNDMSHRWEDMKMRLLKLVTMGPPTLTNRLFLAFSRSIKGDKHRLLFFTRSRAFVLSLLLASHDH